MFLGIGIIVGAVIGFAIGRFSNTHVQIQQVESKDMHMRASQTIIANNTTGNITMTSNATTIKDKE